MKNILSIAIGLLLLACAPRGDIKGNTYLLQDSPAGLQITISFDKEAPNFSGRALNRYFGAYELNGNNINFKGVASTMMAGPEELMKAEREYFNNLEAARNIVINSDNITISGEGFTYNYIMQATE